MMVFVDAALLAAYIAASTMAAHAIHAMAWYVMTHGPERTEDDRSAYTVSFFVSAGMVAMLAAGGVYLGFRVAVYSGGA